MFWLTRSSVCFENIFIMRLSHQSSTSWSYLFLLVMVWGSEVRGQPCPSGQITHHNGGQTKCCLPAYCKPNHYLEFCKKNGTSDTCEECPRRYGLYKRTSSFAVEPCHLLLVTGVGEERCTAQSESKAAMEDRMNCLCNLELGYYYLEPQFFVGPSSFCQVVRDECTPGSQPNQKGHCEPCPPNTVQDENGFKLCRPQRNCFALRLDTKVAGSASREAVCADPPPLPAVSTVAHVVSSTSPTSPPVKRTTPIPSDASVGTVVDSKNDASMIVVLVVVCSIMVVACMLFVFCGRRKGWFACLLKGKCYSDVGRHPGSGSQLQLSNRDNDNTSDNSCYTCTDSCLTSSNKNNSSNSTGGAGAKFPGVCEASKAPRPLPMLEAFMNRNGKCPIDSLSSAGSLSEPIYNSIGQDERLKVSGRGSSMPSYKNTAGLCPSTGLRRDFQDFQPNRVQLVPGDESDCCRKGPLYAQEQPQGGGVGKGGGREPPRDDCNETDPLLPPPGSEHGSSGTPTPVATPALRGILRNGNNRHYHCQETQGSGGGEESGGDRVVVGNRPHLSMLLNVADDTSSPVVGDESQVANLPHLSQLVSAAQRSLQAAPGPPPPQPPQHQQLQQQAVEPPQDVLPPQRGTLQGSPMAARLLPVSLATQQQQQQPQLDPSLVQMDELKPIPLSPGLAPTTPTSPTTTPPQSPARITPTQQVLRVGRGPSNSATHRPEPAPAGLATAAAPPAPTAQTAKKGIRGKTAAAGKQEEDMDVKTETQNSVTKQKEINEETFQKQAASAGAGVGSEGTMQKSVCGSSGLGDSLEFSSPLELPSEEDGRSRTMYRRSNSEASRSVSPVHQLPPSRSISTPEEKHRPFAVVKPMQSDQSLNTMSDSQDCLSELTQHLDAVRRDFPLTSLVSHSTARQTSQTSCDACEQTRPKTPDNLSQDDRHGERARPKSEELTSATFYSSNDSSQGDGADRRDKGGDEGDL